MKLTEWRPGQQPRSLLYCAVTDHTILVAYIPRLWRFKINNGGRKSIFFTSSIKAKCRDKKRNYRKHRKGIVLDVAGSCIAVTVDQYIIPIEKKPLTVVRNTWFPDRSQIRTWYVSTKQIESNSIRLIKNKYFRFKSVLR